MNILKSPDIVQVCCNECVVNYLPRSCSYIYTTVETNYQYHIAGNFCGKLTSTKF